MLSGWQEELQWRPWITDLLVLLTEQLLGMSDKNNTHEE